jgi:hypothetical protein
LAEREMLYSLRDFVRYRKRFSIDVAEAYYRVLQNRDTARNTYLAFQSFSKSAARTQALVDEGRVKVAERPLSSELSQETAWIAPFAATSRPRHSEDSPDCPRTLIWSSTIRSCVELKIIHPDISVCDAIRCAGLPFNCNLGNEVKMRSGRAAVMACCRRPPRPASTVRRTSTQVHPAGPNAIAAAGGFRPAVDRSRRNTSRADPPGAATRARTDAEDTIAQIREIGRWSRP